MQCNACLYDGGGNRSTWSKPTQARGEHANSTQKGPGTTWKDRDANPGPSCCEATGLTTEPPCCPDTHTHRHKHTHKYTHTHTHTHTHTYIVLPILSSLSPPLTPSSLSLKVSVVVEGVVEVCFTSLWCIPGN